MFLAWNLGVVALKKSQLAHLLGRQRRTTGPFGLMDCSRKVMTDCVFCSRTSHKVK
jgi:hypothetical protein